MWKFIIKQDKLVVVKGQTNNKEYALGEVFHYAEVYAEENFSKMTIEIKKEK